MSLVVKYSPEFSGECYQRIPAGRSLMGYSVVSDSGLLELFELRLGLPSWSPEGNARAIEYRNTLERNRAGSFYEKSYDRDPLGTAITVLNWRDTLIMAGWNPSQTWAVGRLGVMAALESDFDSKAFPGESDRWSLVLENLKSCGSPFHDGDVIEVYRSRDVLPYMIVSSLELLGEAVDWTPGQATGNILEVKNASILSFTEYSDALEWIAEKKEAPDTVVINADDMRLNAVLRRHGEAGVAASLNGSNPGIPQIFKLGLSLLLEPLNAHNLLAYLQLPIMPLPSGLARMLSGALLRDNGLGEEWDKAVQVYEKNLQDDAKKAIEGKLSKFLTSLLAARRSDGLVSVDAAKAFCKDITEWARGYLAMNEDVPERPFFTVLESECADMLNVLSKENSTMASDQFDRYIRQIYTPCSVKIESACLGSMHAVRSHDCIIDHPDNLIWLSCNGDLGNTWPYGFLTATEVAELRDNGLYVPDRSVYTRYDFQKMVDCLNSASSVTLCRSSYDKGEALREHPSVTLFRKAGISETHVPSKTWNGPISRFTHVESYALGRDMLGDFSRTESPTSIEELVGYPFDYYLDYVLGLRDQEQTALKNLTLTQGLVAHLVFRELVEDCGKDLDRMESVLNAAVDGEDQFIARVRSAAMKVGATLLLPSVSIIFGSFCGTLKTSLGVLIRLLKENSLEPFACEEPFDVNLGGEIGQVRGSVDFIAENREGDLVIVDFKYSTGTHYTEKLRGDTSVQLEIYSLAIEKKYPGKKVVATGYWFFKANELHTCSRMFSGDNVVVESKLAGTISLKERIENSILFRKEKFRKGDFEVLEGYEVTGTAYYDAIETSGLLPLPVEGKKNPKKKYPLSTATTTKHEILKDNLK